MSFNIQTKRGRLLSVAAALVRRLRRLRLPLTQTGHLVSGILFISDRKEKGFH